MRSFADIIGASIMAEMQETPQDRATRVNATDETRLAAGWSIEVVPVFEADELADNDASSDTSDKEQTPAPSPAGDWRLHVSGRLWVRWVVAP